MLYQLISKVLIGKAEMEDTVRLIAESEAVDRVNDAIRQVKIEHARHARVAEAEAKRCLQAHRGEIDDEHILAVYNTIANILGWETLDNLIRTFTVAVSYKGEALGDFEVEAEDEDSAISDVQDNMSVEATLDIRVEYGGNITGHTTVDIDAWDLDQDDFDYEATEQ